jgi:hypothetical protein
MTMKDPLAWISVASEQPSGARTSATASGSGSTGESSNATDCPPKRSGQTAMTDSLAWLTENQGTEQSADSDACAQDDQHGKERTAARVRPAGLGWLKNGNRPGRFSDAPRCGARSRRTGRPCRAPACRGHRRCRMHGGRSTGPKTPEGLKRSRRARWKTGRYSAEYKRANAAARRSAKEETERLNNELAAIHRRLRLPLRRRRD